ncbi:MAG: alpha/beta fold hydrolase [Oligoflexia bacterium]|nr:alpha/beta fold hydrolase [Oligoflexia bacterium]
MSASNGPDDGSSAPKTALLIHGLTGSNGEMHELAQLLVQRHFRVTNLNLLGHGTTIEDLKRVPLEKWRAQCLAAMVDLGPGPAVCIGLSFGALLALDLAEQFPESVKQCVLLSPAFQLRTRSAEILISALSVLPEWILDHLGEIKKKDNAAARLSVPRTAYSSHALGALGRLGKLRRLCFQNAGKVTAKLLIISDPADHRLSSQSPSCLEGLLRTAPEYAVFTGAQHEMTCGPLRHSVFDRILRFLALDSESNPTNT